MNRRAVLQSLATLAGLPLISACSSSKTAVDTLTAITVKPLNKPHEDWRGLVSPEAYSVLFEEDTEPPGSSPLNREDRAGTFICAACYLLCSIARTNMKAARDGPVLRSPLQGIWKQGAISSILCRARNTIARVAAATRAMYLAMDPFLAANAGATTGWRFGSC